MRIVKVYPKTFWVKEKTNLYILKYLRSKRIEKVYPETFSDQRKDKSVYSKIFKIEEGQERLFKNF